MIFILVQMAIIITGKGLHLTSLWKGRVLEPGNGLLSFLCNDFPAPFRKYWQVMSCDFNVWVHLTQRYEFFTALYNLSIMPSLGARRGVISLSLLLALSSPFSPRNTWYSLSRRQSLAITFGGIFELLIQRKRGRKEVLLSLPITPRSRSALVPIIPLSRFSLVPCFRLSLGKACRGVRQWYSGKRSKQSYFDLLYSGLPS